MLMYNVLLGAELLYLVYLRYLSGTGTTRKAITTSFDGACRWPGRYSGTVIVWWASTGLIMMKSKVHDGPVRQLQFDATKVIYM